MKAKDRVYDAERQLRKPHTNEMKALALAMRDRGATYNEIRAKTGIDKTTMCLWLQKGNLTEERSQRRTDAIMELASEISLQSASETMRRLDDPEIRADMPMSDLQNAARTWTDRYLALKEIKDGTKGGDYLGNLADALLSGQAGELSIEASVKIRSEPLKAVDAEIVKEDES